MDPQVPRAQSPPGYQWSRLSQCLSSCDLIAQTCGLPCDLYFVYWNAMLASQVYASVWLEYPNGSGGESESPAAMLREVQQSSRDTQRRNAARGKKVAATIATLAVTCHVVGTRSPARLALRAATWVIRLGFDTARWEPLVILSGAAASACTSAFCPLVLGALFSYVISSIVVSKGDTALVRVDANHQAHSFSWKSR